MTRPAAAAVLAFAVAAGCRRAPEKKVVFDLARRSTVAELRSVWDVVLSGTPAAEVHEEEGFFKAALDPAGESSSDVAAEAELSFRWPAPAPRVAVVDAAPLSGGPPRTARVLLNGTEVGRLELRDGRRRYRLDLPASSQRPRVNRLRFVFDGVARGDPAARAARFFGVVVGSRADSSLADLLDDGAPPALSLFAEDRIPKIAQAGPSSVRHALLAPEGAELRFTPELHPRARAAGTAVAVEVTMAEGDGEERDLWSGTLRPAGPGPGEVRVPLGARAGAPVRLSFLVGQGRSAFAVWAAPRVLGASGGEPLRVEPLSAHDSARADSLRRSLAGSNVLFVILDAAGARHFGCYGYARRTTPEIDRIAAEGVVFEKAYTPAVFTRAAMAAIWTSRYSEQHHSTVVRDELRLAEDRLTLAELLSAHGVRTAGFVANPNAGPNAGLERGFAEFRGVFSQPGRPGGAVRADALREAFESWLGSRDTRRFFAYLHFREPHFPYDPSPPFDTLFGPDAPLPRSAREEKSWTIRVSLGRERASPEQLDHLVRLYDGNLASVDHQIGALRRSLEAAGLWERTVVIVSADHGEELLEHGFVGHNEQLYEETVKVPLIVRFPKGTGPAGLRREEIVDLVDVAPTVADVFGVLGKGGSDRSFRGRSLLAVVSGAGGKSATVSRSIMKRPAYALFGGRYKLIYDVRRGAEELFDVERDPRERDDLAEKEPLLAACYRQALHRYILDLGPSASAAAPARTPTPEELEQLKALGYIN